MVSVPSADLTSRGAPATLSHFSGVTKTRFGSGSSSCAAIRPARISASKPTSEIRPIPLLPTSYAAPLNPRRLLRTHRSPDHPNLRIILHDLQRVALQWTHLHHLLHVIPQHRHIQKPCIEPRQKELPRPGHMDRSRCRCRQSLMPQPLELHAPGIALLRFLKHLFRLHIQKPQPHRPVAHDPFHVPTPAAPAELLLIVQRHYRVAALPHSLRKRVAPVPNPNAQRPHANHAVQLSMHRSQSRSHP